MVDRSRKNNSSLVPSKNHYLKDLRIHHSVTASELRYVFRFWSKVKIRL